MCFLSGIIAFSMVSVIVPTYNESKNIGRLLKSIKNQSVDCEVIVVDDGSTDETIDIAKKYTSKVFPRKHAERSVQRNFGVSKAKGKHVFIVDADMEFTPKVIESCLKNINGHKALIVPEKTVGAGFMSKVRSFEREMYMGDPTIEVARFFDKKVLKEFGGYDRELTGTEDYDLPYRISKKYTIGWAKEWIFHHEEQLTLPKQLRKKFYYARRSAIYAQKHPELVATQGNMLFRKAYFRNWKKFVNNPLLGLAFVFVRVLESLWAIVGYISAVGFFVFLKTFFKLFW